MRKILTLPSPRNDSLPAPEGVLSSVFPSVGLAFGLGSEKIFIKGEEHRMGLFAFIFRPDRFRGFWPNNRLRNGFKRCSDRSWLWSLVYVDYLYGVVLR